MRNKGLKIIVMLVLSIMLISVETSADNTPLYNITRNDTIAAGEIYEVEYVNGKFIAVGYDGVIKSSEDGVTWVGGITKYHSNLHGTAWGNGHYIAVGDFGMILESPDAISWSKYSGLGTHFRDAAFGKDKFVIISSYGQIYYSADGKQWKQAVSPVTSNLESIIWDGRQFVCAGDNGIVLNSQDGLSWNIMQTGFKAKLRSIAYSGTMYVAVGDNGFTAASVDLKNWVISDAQTNQRFYNVAYGNGIFVAAGGDGDFRKGTIYYSRDGISWNCVGSDLHHGYYGIAWGRDKFIAIGGNWGDMSIISSTDGVMWKEEFGGYNLHLNGIAKSSQMLVAVGEKGLILYSADGKQWSKADSPVNKTLESIVFGDGKFIAFARGEVIASSDGINWVSVAKGNEDTFIRAVWTGSKFAAAGIFGTILVSDDGVNWSSTKIGSYSTYIQGLAFGNGTFVILDRMGSIYTSNDGLKWTQKRQNDLSTDRFLEYASINWVKDQFIVYKNQADKDLLLVSSDGETWVEKPIDANLDIRDIIYEDGVYMAVGLNGMVPCSLDGVNWVNNSDGFKSSLFKVIWNGDGFIAVGPYGNITRIVRKSNLAEIKSEVYRIDNERMVIENIPADTEIESFISKAQLSTGAYYKLLQFDGQSNISSGTLKTGMKLTIVSEDQSKSLVYTLIVNKRSDAELTSNLYKINNQKLTIENVFAATDYLKFMTSFKRSEGALLKITHGNRLITSGMVYPGMKLTITSEDGKVQKTYVLDKAPASIYVNKKLVNFAQTPLVNINTIIAPADELARALGAVYAVDSKTSMIKIKGRTSTIETTIGSKYAKVAGKELKMPSDVKLISTPYMSVQFLAEKLGFSYKYDNSNNSIYITRK